jgi:succinate dehydrogenase hydrophobic anchor subunit
LSLVVVYQNRSNAAVSSWILVVVSAIDLAAIVGGLVFVVRIVDPEKYRRAATKALEEVKTPTATATPSSEFFDAFLHLERLLRDYLKERDLYIPSRGAPRMSFSFRQMVEALRLNEKIDGGFYRELLDLNKYRNLVFHGHVTQVDADMVRRTRDAAARIETLT